MRWPIERAQPCAPAIAAIAGAAGLLMAPPSPAATPAKDPAATVASAIAAASSVTAASSGAAATVAAANSAASDSSGSGAAVPALLGPPPAAPPCSEPLCYTAATLEAERNHIALTDIHIVDTTRGITQIKADRAEANGLDLGNSRWVLTGHVQVYMPQQQLQANAATVQFIDKRIASIAADGAPAEFERQIPRSAQGGPVTVTGHALQITYDLAHDQVQLTGNSWLTDGCNDISTQQITYDITSQRVVAAAVPGESGRVHGTIRTRTGSPCTSGAGRP